MNPVDATVNTPADGRRGRWAGHREQRRDELVSAAVEAIRRAGPDVGMDAVAASAGVSKPVLYRYFADKSQLWLAVRQRAAALVVSAIEPAVAAVREEREVVFAAIDAYLAVIESDPRLYLFVVGQPGAGWTGDPVADVVDTVAGGLARVIRDRLRALGLDPGPAQPWAYALVGCVRTVGDWWLRQARPISRAVLTEYLTTLLWSGIAGVARGAPAVG
jgi:AcrR family transcriptional regulator